MKFKLSFKIFLVSLSVSITCFIFIATLFILSNNRFIGYIDQKEMTRLEYLVDTLVDFYNENRGWEFLNKNIDLWNALMKTGWTKDEYILETRKESSPMHETPTIIVTYQRSNLPIPIWDPLNLGPRICLFDENKKYVIGQNELSIEDCSLLPIKSSGFVIGWLGLGKGEKYIQPLEQAFRKDQSMIFFIMGISFFLLLLGIVFLFSKHILQPITRLVEATNKISQLQFDVRIPIKSSDELGHLAQQFNNMAKKLEDYERNQNQWLSDISHELRTPLSVLICEIDAFKDGIEKPDNESLTALSKEARHLKKLINDIHDISLIEANAFSLKHEHIKPLPILSEMIYIFQNLFKSNDILIEVEFEATAAELLMVGDPDRLRQLFSNILENTIRYVEKPGRLIIRQTTDKNYMKIVFEDSGPGVPDESLPLLFNRLYRLDSSRDRKTGGSGLGLAICKSIVEMHGGKISAQNLQVGGLKLEILFPFEG